MYLTLLTAVLLCAAPTEKKPAAPAAPPTAGTDLTKHGPASRKPKDEKG